MRRRADGLAVDCDASRHSAQMLRGLTHFAGEAESGFRKSMPGGGDGETHDAIPIAIRMGQSGGHDPSGEDIERAPEFE
jgi:hypothetical protein